MIHSITLQIGRIELNNMKVRIKKKTVQFELLKNCDAQTFEYIYYISSKMNIISSKELYDFIGV